MTRERLYIGTYTRGTDSLGIYRASFDTETATLAIEDSVATDNPSFLAIDTSRHKLYAVNEVSDFGGAESGAVTTFAIDAQGRLRVRDQRSSEGALPCHLAVIGGHHLIVANYGGANVCVFPLGRSGLPEAPSHICRHRGQARRQRRPHPHQVTAADGQRVLIPDLGLDRVFCYRLRNGRLEADDPPWANVQPGSGPRHCIVRAAARRVYLINELDNTIDTFELEQAGNALSHLQRLPTLPPGSAAPSACADIHASPAGRFLYGSNRGHDSIVVCEIAEADGTLAVRGHVSSGGVHPRSFGIDPTGRWLLAANRDSDNIVAFRLDSHSGMPEPCGESHLPAPVCVLFAGTVA